MLAALKILLWIYAFGGSISLEHPRGETEGSIKWSIWRSAFMKQLLQAGDTKLLTFLQGPLGQPFPKPTTLLIARLKSLASDLYQNYDRNWQPSEWLGGKQGSEWKTSQAKVYPYRLCKVLAAAHLRHARQLQCEGQDHIPAHMVKAINQLSKLHDPYDEFAEGVRM